jgi:hypothetical protein
MKKMYPPYFPLFFKIEKKEGIHTQILTFPPSSPPLSLSVLHKKEK